MKRILPVSIALVSLLLLILQLTVGDRRGDVYSSFTQDFNDRPILRVISHHEKYCFGGCGSIHVFQSFQDGNWREITAFRHDDSISFSGKNIKIQNENFAYFWFGWKFGASINSGKTWTIWDAQEDDLMRKSINYGLIENVIIEPNGKGKMFFNSTGKERSSVSFLKTENFGQIWHR